MSVPPPPTNMISKGDQTPVTVFTGFVGVGKTTIILSLLDSMPKDYRFCLLKNEFGDVNGPIAWQIRELADDGFVLDSILNVVDCVNFNGYADNSYTAQLQAQYTDLVLLTKHEGLSERDIDRVIDRVNDLNTDAPKVFVNKNEPISPDLIFGLDTKLFDLKGVVDPNADGMQAGAGGNGGEQHHSNEFDTIEVRCFDSKLGGITLESLEKFLKTLAKDEVYRLKGFVRLLGNISADVENSSLAATALDVEHKEAATTVCIVNHAFGKWTIVPIPKEKEAGLMKKDCCSSNEHEHEHSSGSTCHAGKGLPELHLIFMGDLRALKYKLIHGCGSAYGNGHASCHFRPTHEVIDWEDPLPETYNNFVTEMLAKKQK
ncbi:hypothetical protein BGW38_005042 [Lunasporangiospora selenospora]|uniref:CobW/HypB/UreG nucleotide-binding domain-containing protein n=1 Tax=Lunasporangiospora selenospora TaxID=979761 RepID=A0A9P6KIR3_9FUNG|nr:hypothetical protein BGW38_005042 [Lunasporangiospora selenospora]